MSGATSTFWALTADVCRSPNNERTSDPAERSKPASSFENAINIIARLACVRGRSNAGACASCGMSHVCVTSDGIRYAETYLDWRPGRLVPRLPFARPYRNGGPDFPRPDKAFY